ncbi:MAG TPA: hypothetical protein VIH10_00545 [Kribbella sp.]|jgi:hypothetical protein
MGTTGGSKGRSAPPTPAVVGIGRSMRARDVSRPRRPVERRPVIPEADAKLDTEADRDVDSGVDTGEQGAHGTGGSSPVDS